MYLSFPTPVLQCLFYLTMFSFVTSYCDPLEALSNERQKGGGWEREVRCGRAGTVEEGKLESGYRLCENAISFQ